MTFTEVLNLVYFYPFIMSLLWIGFAFRFYINYMRYEKKQNNEAKLDEFPMVSILVPCYNEEATIEETIFNLIKELTYPNYEIICVDDGSKDKTWEILLQMRSSDSTNRIRIIKVVNNAGKAHALTQAAIAARGEFLLGLDADSFLQHDAIHHLVANMQGKKNTIDSFLGQRKGIGAVTGSPIVRNRSTLLAKAQLVEYASVIGLIKRAQRLYGRIGTVSGVCVLYRKRALMDVGWWDQDMITEDISATWKLQVGDWEAHYEPSCICWMLVPESIKGIYKQRLRWAQGGSEVMLRNMNLFLKPKKWAHLPLLLEQIISLAWSYLWYIAMFVFFWNWFVGGFLNWISLSLGALLVLICMIQLLVSLKFSNREDPLNMRFILWAGWYPYLYWLINPFTVVFAFPKAIMTRIKGGQATWVSPDRGQTDENDKKEKKSTEG